MTRPKPYRPPTSITLARIPVRRELVDQLEDDPAGDRLRRALENDTRILQDYAVPFMLSKGGSEDIGPRSDGRTGPGVPRSRAKTSMASATVG